MSARAVFASSASALSDTCGGDNTLLDRVQASIGRTADAHLIHRSAQLLRVERATTTGFDVEVTSIDGHLAVVLHDIEVEAHGIEAAVMLVRDALSGRIRVRIESRGGRTVRLDIERQGENNRWQAIAGSLPNRWVIWGARDLRWLQNIVPGSAPAGSPASEPTPHRVPG